MAATWGESPLTAPTGAPPPRSYRRSVLVRQLAGLRGFPEPDPSREQVVTPPEAAALLLESALARDDLEGRSVVDLGCGTGILAIGAALLGAHPVRGVDSDERALAVARSNAEGLGAKVVWEAGDVAGFPGRCDTVVMNPPFGAQRRHADRPFWEAALAAATRRVYGFALGDSRTFIAGRAVARGARVEATQPVPWELLATFRHHRKPRVEIPVDLWILTPQAPR